MCYRFIAIACVLLICFSAKAETVYDKEGCKSGGELWMVKTSPGWLGNENARFLRIYVCRSVGEHAKDNVFAELIAVKNKKQHVEWVRHLETPLYKGFIEGLDFIQGESGELFILFDIYMKGMKGIVLRDIFIFEQGSNNIRKIVDAKYVDFD